MSVLAALLLCATAITVAASLAFMAGRALAREAEEAVDARDAPLVKELEAELEASEAALVAAREAERKALERRAEELGPLNEARLRIVELEGELAIARLEAERQAAEAKMSVELARAERDYAAASQSAHADEARHFEEELNAVLALSPLDVSTVRYYYIDRLAAVDAELETTRKALVDLGEESTQAQRIKGEVLRAVLQRLEESHRRLDELVVDLKARVF